MIGQSLRTVPGLHPQTPWTFVSAPLGGVGPVAIWHNNTLSGIIYIAPEHYRYLRQQRLEPDLDVDLSVTWSTNPIDTIRPLRSQLPIRDVSKRDVTAFATWFQRAIHYPQMMEAAYVIVALLPHDERGTLIRRMFVDLVDSAVVA